MAKRLGKRTTETATTGGSGGNLTAGTFNDYFAEYAAALTAQEKAASATRNVLKRAKGVGINIKLLKQMRTEQRADRDTLVAEHREAERYRKWLRLPEGYQADLLAAEETEDDDADGAEEISLADAADRGFAAGKRGDDRLSSNPFEAGTERHVAFDENWMKGNAENAPAPTRSRRKPAAPTEEEAVTAGAE